MYKFIFIGMLVFCISCSSDPSQNLVVTPTPSLYVDSINSLRAMNDKELKTDPHSPLEKEKIESFEGLSYYVANEKWNIHASYLKIDTASVFDFPTTTERVIPMIKDGLIRFTVNGDTFQLFAYRYIEHPEEDLFVPFLDETNGDDTYGGGRYVEVKWPENDSIWIDFNMAYNPYCAYNHNYSCPIPPLENLLSIEISAGEKVLYHY
tara:strand:- start:50838 stop:51458 length:621 start_codon:yes stop_codon:yes gene_type:complete